MVAMWNDDKVLYIVELHKALDVLAICSALLIVHIKEYFIASC